MRALKIICFAAAVLVHFRGMKKDDNYIKKTIGLAETKTRIYAYDYLRILAVLMVILTHAIQAEINEGPVQGPELFFVMTMIGLVCMACNMIYVMLSGGLLIPYREEKLSDFYIKRISKVAVPLAVYFVFYLRQNLQLEQISFSAIMDILRRLYEGNMPEAPHFWMIYVILSLYIVIPFLRYMFKDMPYRTVTAFVGISFAAMIISFFAPVNSGILILISTWVGAAVMGYWVSRSETKKYYRWLIAAGAAGVAVLLAAVIMGEDYWGLCNGCSPVMAVISLGIFAMVLGSKNLFHRGNVIVRILSKYSYSMILVHWWSLYRVTRGKFHISVLQWHGAGLLASLAVTLAVSFAAAFVIDHVVVVVAQTVFDGIVRIVRMAGKRKK